MFYTAPGSKGPFMEASLMLCHPRLHLFPGSRDTSFRPMTTVHMLHATEREREIVLGEGIFSGNIFLGALHLTVHAVVVCLSSCSPVWNDASPTQSLHRLILQFVSLAVPTMVTIQHTLRMLKLYI